MSVAAIPIHQSHWRFVSFPSLLNPTYFSNLSDKSCFPSLRCGFSSREPFCAWQDAKQNFYFDFHRSDLLFFRRLGTVAFVILAYYAALTCGLIWHAILLNFFYAIFHFAYVSYISHRIYSLCKTAADILMCSWVIVGVFCIVRSPRCQDSAMDLYIIACIGVGWGMLQILFAGRIGHQLRRTL